MMRYNNALYVKITSLLNEVTYVMILTFDTLKKKEGGNFQIFFFFLFSKPSSLHYLMTGVKLYHSLTGKASNAPSLP